MLKSVKRILESPDLQMDLSEKSRATAKRFFHIKDYLAKWEEVFSEAMI